MAQTRLVLKEWNAERLLERTTQILEDYAPVVAEEARNQLKLQKWQWPNSTLRFRSLFQRGQTVKTRLGSGVVIPKGKRDIVDTGFLLSSQQAPQVSGNSLSILWTAPYAGEVLRGVYPDPYFSPTTRKPVGPVGKKLPRNWIEGAFDAEPPVRFFVRRWRELASATQQQGGGAAGRGAAR